MNSVVLSDAMNVGERAGYAGRMFLIGMVTIFAALAILWGALALFRMLAGSANREKAPKEELPPNEAPIVAPSVPAPADDGAIVAAITAAISVVLAEENGGTCPAFRVVSFKRSRHH